MSQLIHPRTVYRSSGSELVAERRSNRELAKFITRTPPARMSDLVGMRGCSFAGAPGTGRHIYEITRVDEDGVWGQTISDTIR